MPTLYNQHRRISNDENMIPLINIVFLMLIFFLVAGKISAQDSALFTAPESIQEEKLDMADITILLASDETIWINNKAVSNDLSLQLKNLGINPEMTIVLKVDASLPASMLDPILSELQSLGIQRLKLVTIAVGA
jgi:biopolymer transport protein ExbD